MFFKNRPTNRTSSSSPQFIPRECIARIQSTHKAKELERFKNRHKSPLAKMAKELIGLN